MSTQLTDENPVISISTGSVQKSISLAAIAKALIAFHKKIPKIPKSSRNPFLKSKYADLSTILDIVEPILAEVGLSICQMPVGEHELTTLLIHESGEWIESTYKMQPLDSVVDTKANLRAITPQSIGSVITYQRRYAIGAILSLNIDDDNDANPLPGQVSDEPEVAAPKLSAKELLEQKKREAEAAKQAAQAPAATAPTQTIPALAATSNGPAQVSTDSKCTEDQIATVKRLLTEWNQVSPGVDVQFVQNLKASGRNKIADLSIAECGKLIEAITARALTDFFGHGPATKAA